MNELHDGASPSGGAPSPSSAQSTASQRGVPAQARGEFVMRDRPGVLWLVLAVIAVLVHRWLPGSRWLMVHLVVLGAVTHSITVWSNHFAIALLKPAPQHVESRTVQTRRLLLLNVGILLVVVGVPTTWWPVAMIGATLVAAEVLWHAAVLIRMSRAALPSRFAITVRYYVAASLIFPVGITLGVLLARGLADPAYERVLVAHTMINLLGWVGLTVLGTLLTLWPTVLRARMDERAAHRATVAAFPLVSGVLVVALGALLGIRWISVAGLVIYLVGVLITWTSMWGPLRRTRSIRFGGWSLGLGQLWLVAALVTLILDLGRHDWLWVGTHYGHLTAMFVAGFVAQTLFGAMSHLIPSVLGGGPKVFKAGAAQLEKWGGARVVALNGGLLLALLPLPSVAIVLTSLVAFIALAAFIPLMFRGIHAAVAARRAVARGEADSIPAPPQERPWAPQATATLAALALVVATGSALGGTTSTLDATAGVAATGHTTKVAVTANHMRFSPATITVPAGDRLVITVTNKEAGQVHDLVLANGATSGRLSTGETRTVDAGVIGRSMQGWCSVIGHRQAGMTLQINVRGSSASSTSASGSGSSTAAAPSYRSGGTPAAGFQAWNPSLPALSSGTTHKVTFTVTESTREVAPGIRTPRWTYNGGLASPVLHGRVGDTFEVTLVNKGTMGHSIDFHAGTLAPDQPMRTIAPGKSLVYRFVASRSGIWMYHCSTAPVSTHIAAGMAGAVVIDPPGLSAVDASYVFVQSDIYAGSGSTLDTSAVASKTPNLVVFNGYAGQYDSTPIKVKTGQRIRIWVLDVGPNTPSSFHVIGGQFDTVYKEGAWLLKRGKDAFGDSGGGAQTLDLEPAQGGFVELTFPEAGHYPFVSHIMSDAEKGAHGIFEVTG